MKTRLISFLLILCSATAAYTQKPAVNTPQKQKPLPRVVVQLGAAMGDSAVLSKQDFDRNARAGLKLIEPAGAVIERFNFSYAEPNFYEDSVGNIIRVVDNLSEVCPGDTLTPVLKGFLFDHTKSGDTLYFDGIHVRLPDGRATRAKAMRFIIK